MSQKSLAKQIGVWDTYISQIEKGEKVPSDELCLKIGIVLDLDTRELLLRAYIARTQGETRSLFEEMFQLLSDPFLGRLKQLNWLDAEIMEFFSKPDFGFAIQSPQWRQVFLDAFGLKGRDVLPVVRSLMELNTAQWTAVFSILSAMSPSAPSDRPPSSH